jgi:diguanylate cyclase (GGDEF)-like protein/PAS domain S-box-containing protein
MRSTPVNPSLQRTADVAVSFPARFRTWITRPVRLLAVPVVGAAFLVGGAVGAMPVPVALAAGIGVVATWVTAILVRTALAIHHSEGAFAACRGAGFIGMAALATGLTATLPTYAPPGLLDPLLGAGIGAAAGLYVVGTMLLPGAATTVSVRLRRAFDGLGLGVSLGFAGWLLLPPDRTSGTALAAALAAAAGISIVTITVLRAYQHRQEALRCGAGAVAVLIGLCTVATVLAYDTGTMLLLAAGLLVVVGLAATVAGAGHVDLLPPRPEPREAEPHLSGYPLLAIPAAVGVIAALYHLITVGQFDRTAISLGLAMVSVLTMRELLAVTDIRRYAARLKAQEAHFRSLVTGATDLTLVLDDRMMVRWQSPAAARLFGLADAEVLGRPFVDMIHPDDVGDVRTVVEALVAGEQAAGPPALVIARLRDGHGIWRETESTVSDQRAAPEVAALVVHVRDVGERKHLERTLQRLSYTDQLTGLANRRALMRDLLARRQRPGQPGTLLVIDLHGLAEINDSRGREIGDAALIEVSRRIRSLLGDDDVAARLGGAEYAVLTSDGAVLAYALSSRLVTSLMEPIQLPGQVVELHTSIGLAELAGGSDSDEVLRHADLARSRARQLGRDRVEWYDTDIEVQLHRRMGLEREIIGAAERGELDLVFQPVLSLKDGHPVGVEALLRWRHPQLGTILPAELLPIAQAVGISAQLVDWVVNAACRRLDAWSEGGATAWMSINIAPKELLDVGFPDRIAGILAAYGLAPERFVVEVAETWIAEDVPAVVAALAALRKLGVRAALDDFGAGQASLSHLRRLPVDMLKLDRALVDSQAERRITGPAIIDVVVSLGRRLGLEIVAKGLETQEQIERARSAGCLLGQGFALAHPAPAERMEAYLDSHRTSSP